MRSLITLFNILKNKKVRHLGKRKQTARPGNAQENYTLQNTQLRASKKLLFIPMKIQLITIRSAFPYISGMNSTSSSLKKKILKKKKGRGKEKKRKCEREGKGEGKGKERKERE